MYDILSKHFPANCRKKAIATWVLFQYSPVGKGIGDRFNMELWHVDLRECLVLNASGVFNSKWILAALERSNDDVGGALTDTSNEIASKEHWPNEHIAKQTAIFNRCFMGLRRIRDNCNTGIRNPPWLNSLLDVLEMPRQKKSKARASSSASTISSTESHKAPKNVSHAEDSQWNSALSWVLG